MNDESVPFYEVSERALAQRINRALAANGEALRKAREGSRMAWEYGPYYSVDIQGNYIIDQGINLEPYGRHLGVLKHYERLREEG